MQELREIMRILLLHFILFVTINVHAQLSPNIRDISRSTANWRNLQENDLQHHISDPTEKFQRKIPSFIEKERENFHNAILNDRESILINGNIEHDNERKMQENDEYHPFRIGFITTELEDKMDDERIQFLMGTVLPSVKEFYSKLLNVKPFPDGNIDVSSVSCFGPDVKLPSDIQRNGVRDADVAIYVKAEDCGLQGALAAASPCSLSGHDFRPLVGIIFFCLESRVMEPDDSENPEAVSVSIHEIAHVLGMNSDLFPFFVNRDTGKPFLRNIKSDSSPSSTVCTDGTSRRVLLPSTDVLRSSESSSGARHFEVVTPTVRTIVRNQFDCQELTGARLENQPTAPTDCFGSHWDERLFYTESMSAIHGRELNALSSLTLALLEDSGWYLGNYEMTTMSTFGLGAGCGFVNEDCITGDGLIPSSSKGFFCNSLSSLRRQSLQCTPTHGGIGYCDLFDFESENLDPMFLPPKEFQYLDDNFKSPIFFNQADYCPMTLPIDAGNCRTERQDQMCVNIESNRRNFIVECVQFICNKDLKKLQMSTFDSSEILTCERDFQMLDHPMVSWSQMECPRLAVMCPEFVCPSNCSGKGVCDYSREVPTCVCFDQNDRSASCNGESPPLTTEPSSSPSIKPIMMRSEIPTLLPSQSSSKITLAPTSVPSNSHLKLQSNAPTSLFAASKIFFSRDVAPSNLTSHVPSLSPVASSRNNEMQNVSFLSIVNETDFKESPSTDNEESLVRDSSLKETSSSILIMPRIFIFLSTTAVIIYSLSA